MPEPSVEGNDLVDPLAFLAGLPPTDEPMAIAEPALPFLSGLVPAGPIKNPRGIDPNLSIPPCVLRKLSPTAFSIFEEKPDQFVCQYVLGFPRQPQTQPMAIGSAFDCRVKGYLAEQLLGLKGEFERLFYDKDPAPGRTPQPSVEPQHQKWALEHGEIVFEKYKKCGALANLMIELDKLQGVPTYEFNAVGTLVFEDGYTVPIGGKPDWYFLNAESAHVILDWKVTGYMSKASPKPGYVRLMNEQGRDLGFHKNVVPYRHRGMICGSGLAMKEDWKTQLTMYEWMIPNVVQEEVEWITGIEQLVFEKIGTSETRIMRAASYRITLENNFRIALKQRLRRAWECISAGHYYPSMTKEESDNRVRMLMSTDNTTRKILTGG